MPATLEGKVALVTGVSHDGQVGQANSIVDPLDQNTPSRSKSVSKVVVC